MLDLPWLEIAIALPLLGAAWVSRLHQPERAFWWGVTSLGGTLGAAVLAWLGFELGEHAAIGREIQISWLGRAVFGLDGLSAPLVPAVALVHFLTALATGRTKMRRFSLSWSLSSLGLALAMFGCTNGWLLVSLLAFSVVLPYAELRNRGQPTRVYVLHMALFVALLIVGWALVDPEGPWQAQNSWATLPLLAAVLIRCGVAPFHCWLTDWFEHASFGNALLFVTPLVGVYAALRLVLPVAPDWVLSSIGVFSLATALYAAAMAAVQREARRFFAYLFLSHASLVLVGLELHTAISLTGALALWLSVILSLGGLGLTLRAVEARYGRISLAPFHGLYEHSPALAVSFALTGLASVGFPGTLGFVATELLVDGAVEVSPWVGLTVALAAAINGIAVVRAYFHLFTGNRHTSTVCLMAGPRERFAVLILTALILGGGIFPQPGIVARHRAAIAILERRDRRGGADQRWLTEYRTGESGDRGKGHPFLVSRLP